MILNLQRFLNHVSFASSRTTPPDRAGATNGGISGSDPEDYRAFLPADPGRDSDHHFPRTVTDFPATTRSSSEYHYPTADSHSCWQTSPMRVVWIWAMVGNLSPLEQVSPGRGRVLSRLMSPGTQVHGRLAAWAVGGTAANSEALWSK